MGFLDLSSNASSKKHVDFSDARYQLSDKLKQSENKNVRASFTLYDNKETKKTAVQEILASYALSDKKLPIGELLNKMVDLVIDMEDGVLNTEKDAVYAWKYSMALLDIFDDKAKRQESLASFDNSLKTSVINSRIFVERYPGKYTSRTNFFDVKIKEELVNDIIETFKMTALPGIHETAINQSHKKAEEHNNPILDKIVKWAVENYKCEVDSFFQVKKDESTGLFFSVNTVIIHLRNGYDMSVIGYVGTDYDDKFAVSVLDTQKITIQKHNERISQKELQNTLDDASEREPISPLTKLLSIEKKRNGILKQQYDILAAIRPMIPDEVLKIKAAESVVGHDYVWGCAKFRETHDDLPDDFKLEDVVLPEYKETEEMKREKVNEDFLNNIAEMAAESVEMVRSATSEDVEGSVVDMVEEVEVSKQEKEEKKKEEEKAIEAYSKPIEIPKEKTADDLINEMVLPEDLFGDETEEKEKKQEQEIEESLFGDPKRTEKEAPVLTIPTSDNKQEVKKEEKEKQSNKDFDIAATLLPGAIPVVKKEKNTGPSITRDAKPVPTFDTTLLKNVDIAKDSTENEKKEMTQEKMAVKEEIVENMNEPELLLDDLSSLFE